MLNKENIIKRMENNMFNKLQYIPSKLETMKVQKLGDTLVVDSGLPSDTFNAAYGGNVDRKKALDVMKHYRNKKLPMAWWIGPSSLENNDIIPHLEFAGFTHAEIDIGMYCQLSSDLFLKYKIPSNLEIIKCNTAQTFKDFGNVLSSIFNPIDEHVETFYQKFIEIKQKDKEDLELFVGYVNGYPVSTSGLFLTDVAGIYDISTIPKERKKGYGSAMLYNALKEAQKKDFKISVLQASPDGLNIYKSFGYEALCEFNVWSNKNTF